MTRRGVKDHPKSRDDEFVTKIPKVVSFKASRPSQAVNCFDGTCGRCKLCQGSFANDDPERWLGGS